MWIMNVVWPVTALFDTAWVVWQYFTYGRLAEHSRAHAAMQRGEEMPSRKQTPHFIMIANAALHCGSGCTLGDILAETLLFLARGIAIWFGWHWLFAEKLYAVWVVNFLFAYAFGVVFQYFTIKPMRDVSVAQGIWQAIKADTLSLTTWQIGMYGFMAFATHILFRDQLGVSLDPGLPEFWFITQLAMLCGFTTAYPIH